MNTRIVPVPFWQKIVIASGLCMTLLAFGLIGVYYWSMQRSARDINVHGGATLEDTNRSFLQSIISGQAEAIDQQLEQAKNTVRVGAEMIEPVVTSGGFPSLHELELLLLNSGPYVTTIYYLPVDGPATFLLKSKRHPPVKTPVTLHNAGFLSLHKERSTDEPVSWSGVHASPFTLVYDRVVDAVTPFFSGEQVVGYLGISVSVMKMAAQFNHRQAIRGSYNFLLNQERELIACPPLAVMDLSPEGGTGTTRNIIDLSNTGNRSLDRVLYPMALGNESVELVSFKRGRKYLAYKPLKNSSLRLGLVVPEELASISINELDTLVSKRSRTAVLEMLSVSALFLGVTLLLIGIATRKLMEPLTEITTAARRMDGGNLNERIPISGNDELGVLAASFNGMSVRLMEYIEGLESSQVRYKILFESSPVSLWEVDFSRAKNALDKLECGRGESDLRRSLINNEKKVKRLLSLVKVEDVNISTLNLLGLNDKEHFFQCLPLFVQDLPLETGINMLLAVAENRMFEFESQWHTLDRKELNIALRSSVPPGFEDQWSKILISIFDLTEQKRIQQENEKLEKQLNQAQKMEAIGTLTGGIAHDFNNILSSIFGFTELAKLDIDTESGAQESLDHVFVAAERAKELVQHLLTFSRKSDVEKTVFKVCPLIKESLKFIEATAPSTIRIVRNLVATEVCILGDITQMHQVFMNIFTNAVHSMKAGGGTLSVHVDKIILHQRDAFISEELAPGPYILISISDTGYGISKEHVSKVFDPFFTTKGIGEGTGLGLSVTYGIIKEMQGHISVYSEEGTGTTFKIFLPECTTEDAHAAKPSRALQRGEGTILLVDDEQEIIEWMTELLTRLGYTVVAESNPENALELLTETPDHFDLVITDLTMPEMTGTDLAKAVRTIRADLPIILCTGFSEGLTDEMLGKVGVSKLLMKPVIVSDLSTSIETCLQKRS